MCVAWLAGAGGLRRHAQWLSHLYYMLEPPAESVVDKYAFIRDAWVQRRRSQVHDGYTPREMEE